MVLHTGKTVAFHIVIMAFSVQALKFYFNVFLNSYEKLLILLLLVIFSDLRTKLSAVQEQYVTYTTE